VRRRRRSHPDAPDASDELLRSLIEEHADAIYRVAYSVVRDPHLAEDVVQEAVIKAWRAAPSWRGEGSMRSWVLSIAHNTAVSMLRRARDEAHAPASLPERSGVADEVERAADGRADLAALARALDALDPLSRSIVVLRDIEALSYEQIAETLGVPLPTVKTRLLRARRELQRVVLEGAPS